jgi:signal transduction histidine kinase
VRRLLELARADVMQVSASDRAEVAAVVRRLAARHRDAGLTVSVVEPLPSASVAMAEDVLESILGNLFDNARQHGGDAVTVTVTCPAPGAEADATLLIEVSDNGPGISAANAARVFEPFFTTARARGGTGLGLAVVKSLLTAHRGAIELGESTAGTRLRIRLPQ